MIVASHNPGKVREIEDLIAPFGVATATAAELDLAEPEETGETFMANAELKARMAATAAGEPALGDDSGLVVDALSGAPGIYSARWAGPNRDFDAAMRRIESELGARGAITPARRAARFIAVLALCWPDGHCEIVEGDVRGSLVWPRRGEGGFGYDPMFLPNGEDLTFGEMDPALKRTMSHRAVALRKLVDACFGPAR